MMVGSEKRRTRRSGGFALALVLAGTAACPLPLQAAQEVGEAVIVISSVRGLQGQITREIAVEDNVFSQEIIETGPDAATRIVFLDGTELSMGPASSVTLDRYVYDPARGTGELVMNVISGVFEFASGSIPAAGYDIRTPFATIAVRGTRIDIVATGGEGVLNVKEGTVLLSTPGGTLELQAGECFVVIPGASQPEVRQGDACIPPTVPVALMLAALAAGPGRTLAPPPGIVPAQIDRFPGGGIDDDDPFELPTSPN